MLSAAIVGRYGGVNSGYSFLRRAYEAGLKGYVDIIGWNGYPGGAPESSAPVENGVPAGNTLPAQFYLHDLIDQYDPGRKVWIMEMGWSTCAPCNVSAANGATEAQQADYLTRAFAYRRRYLGNTTERIFWYQLRDSGTDRGNWFDNEGVVHNDFFPKPALAAFRALGVEEPAGAPGTGSGTGSGGSGGGSGAPSGAALPAAAARLALPTRVGTPGGSVSLGRPRLTAHRGVLTLTFTVALKGGSSKVRVDGFRNRRWRLITTLKVPRSGKLSVRFADRGYLGIRVRATAPGRARFRVGRVLRVPARFR